jgi:hypothetical protein
MDKETCRFTFRQLDWTRSTGRGKVESKIVSVYVMKAYRERRNVTPSILIPTPDAVQWLYPRDQYQSNKSLGGSQVRFRGTGEEITFLTLP